jgi:hypothetical protein
MVLANQFITTVMLAGVLLCSDSPTGLIKRNAGRLATHRRFAG